MKKIIQQLVNYKFTILTLGIILFFSLKGGESINRPWFLQFKESDKVLHFLMYGFLTMVYLAERTYFLKTKRKTNPVRWYYVLWIILIGAAIEIVQPILADRTKDIWDFIANTGGIFIAYFTFFLINKHYNFNSISSS
ncbi:MAG: VanZ family protein [Bacteroidota bacterium]